MEDEDIDPSSILGEFSLEDTYDELKALEKELQYQLDDLISKITNNEVKTLSSSMTPELLEAQRCQFAYNTMKNLTNFSIKAAPLANTQDLYLHTIQELEDEVRKMEIFEKTVIEEVNEVEKHIASLENERDGLQKMKEACVGAIEDVANATYDPELAIAKRLFAKVKSDLTEIVEMLCFNNDDFQDLLAQLTIAYMKGGEDTYVDVEEESVDCAQFLVEADIARYHRNDKTKLRLMDLV